MIFAPIALFTYSRADHTRQAVESLLLNKEAAESDLYIFSDGPKTEEKREAVEENRRYIHSITGFKSIHIVEREKNWGLANSLIAGITDVVNRYGRVIVVEDDLILSPYFLQYMNEALEKYKDEDKVGAISGFVFPTTAPLPETFFLSYFHCWGWATWKRSWDLLETDSKLLLRKMRFKERKFDLNHYAGNYGILYCQHKGKVDSWYIRFYASLFLAGKLNLFPNRSLVLNGGLDNSGTHCGHDVNLEGKVIVSDSIITVGTADVTESREGYNAFSEFFRSAHGKEVSSWVIFKAFMRRLLYMDLS